MKACELEKMKPNTVFRIGMMCGSAWGIMEDLEKLKRDSMSEQEQRIHDELLDALRAVSEAASAFYDFARARDRETAQQ